MLGVIVLAHGSRDPQWRGPVEAVAAEVRRLAPHALADCAYLELTAPDLADCADRLVALGATELRVLPLFFGMGRHAREQLPRRVDALRHRLPGVSVVCLPPAGEHPALIHLLATIALEGTAPT